MTKTQSIPLTTAILSVISCGRSMAVGDSAYNLRWGQVPPRSSFPTSYLGGEVAMLLGKLMFGDIEIASIGAETELAGRLAEIRDHFNPPNPMVELVHSNGNILVLGISRRKCYVDYVEASLSPPYFSSLGNANLSRTEGYVRFRVDNQYTKIPKRNCIAFSKMVLVARAFLETGARPEQIIEWEMD